MNRTSGRLRAGRRTSARAALLAVEGLETRSLLSTALPDLALVSATTVDSRGVTLVYDIKNGLIDQPISFTVERSAAPAAQEGDLSVGTVTVNPPGAGNAGTLDDEGMPATSVGHHQVTLTLSGGLPPTPALPYVVVVAAPNNAYTESASSASFRVYTIGVITHGGLQPRRWSQYGPPWERQMAADLRSEGYDAVIPVNWVGVSSIAGIAAKVAPRVVPMIENYASAFPAGSPVDLHLIGHSEGTVINSLVVKDLNAQGWPANLQAGFLKVTMLDPHAANSLIKGPQYSVSNDQLGLGQLAKYEIDTYQSRAKDPLPVVTPNVQSAEIFFQHTPVKQSQANDGIYNLWGDVPVKGNATYFNLTAKGMSHAGPFGVQDWYLRNVVPSLGTGGTTIAQIALTGHETAATPSSTSPNRTDVTYSGQAAAGSTVRLLVARGTQRLVTPVGSSQAGTDGSWSITTPPLAPGHFRVIASSNVPTSTATTVLGRPLFLRPTNWIGPLTLPSTQPTA
jgi:hypothetical protein